MCVHYSFHLPFEWQIIIMFAISKADVVLNLLQIFVNKICYTKYE